MPRKPAQPNAKGRGGKHKQISDKTYEAWKDIVYALYFRLNYSKRTIVKWFEGALSESVLREVTNRIRYENPDDPLCLRKTQNFHSTKTLEGKIASDRYWKHLNDSQGNNPN